MHCALGGYLGIHKTLSSLLHHVWWLGLLHEVSAFVHGCRVCQWQKDLTSAPTGLLKPLDNPAECFSVWSMEFITDLPLSGLFIGMFTVVDKLTKWVKLIPMVVGEGELSALSVAHLFFNHIMYSFGVPHMVLHDWDPHFT